MTTARQLRFSYEDYLKVLDESPFRLEYVAGTIFALPGGTIAHAGLCARAIELLGAATRGRCRVLSSDAKVRVDTSDFAGFPDASVVCGPVERSRIDANALVNPQVLVEVTSRSTEDYDRGEKLRHYQLLPSLRAVLIISHRERRVTVVELAASGWRTTEVLDGEAVVLAEPSLRFDVASLYGGVELEP